MFIARKRSTTSPSVEPCVAQLDDCVKGHADGTDGATTQSSPGNHIFVSPAGVSRRGRMSLTPFQKFKLVERCPRRIDLVNTCRLIAGKTDDSHVARLKMNRHFSPADGLNMRLNIATPSPPYARLTSRRAARPLLRLNYETPNRATNGPWITVSNPTLFATAQN